MTTVLCRALQGFNFVLLKTLLLDKCSQKGRKRANAALGTRSTPLTRHEIDLDLGVEGDSVSERMQS